MNELNDSDYIWFAIPKDGRGPSFGPVLNRSLADRHARAMPGYVVGFVIDASLSYEPRPELPPGDVSDAASDRERWPPLRHVW